MNERGAALLIADEQVALELGVDLQECDVAFDSGLDQVRLLMRLDILAYLRIVPVLPVAPHHAVRAVLLLPLPVRQEQVLLALSLRVKYLRESPLVSVGARDTEVQEAFSRRMRDPVQPVLRVLLSFMGFLAR